MSDWKLLDDGLVLLEADASVPVEGGSYRHRGPENASLGCFQTPQLTRFIAAMAGGLPLTSFVTCFRSTSSDILKSLPLYLAFFLPER